MVFALVPVYGISCFGLQREFPIFFDRAASTLWSWTLTNYLFKHHTSELKSCSSPCALMLRKCALYVFLCSSLLFSSNLASFSDLNHYCNFCFFVGFCLFVGFFASKFSEAYKRSSVLSRALRKLYQEKRERKKMNSKSDCIKQIKKYLEAFKNPTIFVEL